MPLLADGKRKLAVIHHHFEVFLARIHNRDAAYLGRLQRLLGKGHRIFVILDNVDLFPAQLANDGLHPHALHAHTSADRINVFVLRHNRDLRALTGLSRNGADHHRSIVNLWNFGLEKMLHQFGRRARNHDLWSLGSFLHPQNHHPNPLADGERFQSRLFLSRHA